MKVTSGPTTWIGGRETDLFSEPRGQVRGVRAYVSVFLICLPSEGFGDPESLCSMLLVSLCCGHLTVGSACQRSQ